MTKEENTEYSIAKLIEQVKKDNLVEVSLIYQQLDLSHLDADLQQMIAKEIKAMQAASFAQTSVNFDKNILLTLLKKARNQKVKKDNTKLARLQ